MNNIINIFGSKEKKTWLKGAEVVGDGRYVQKKDKYKAIDGSEGITTSITWTDSVGTTHTITVKNGLITAYSSV